MKNNILAILLIVSLSNATAFASDFKNASLSAGFEFSSGNYGLSSNTNIFIIPVEGMYRNGPWVFNVAIPYIWITGSEGILPNGIRSKAPPMSTNTTRFGLGDIETSATYNILSEQERGTRIDLTGKIKFGTAEKYLGTEKEDYVVQLDMYKMREKFTPMLSLGYEFLGSTADLKLNDVAYGILGGDYLVDDQMHAGFELLLAQKNSADGANRSELSLYINRDIGNDIYMRGYVLKGFSDGSPDGGLGVKFISYY